MSDHPQLKEMKKKIRTEAKALAASLAPEYRRSASDAVFRAVTAMPEYREAETIFCFVSMPSEVDTNPLIRDALTKNKRVCVPKCLSLGHMEAYPITSMEKDLKPGTWNIPEPREGILPVSPEELDLVIVPCCAAAPDGRRLGFGGGFYDRFLLRTDAFRALICYGRLLREDIPTGEYDLRMDAVISEQGVLRSGI